MKTECKIRAIGLVVAAGVVVAACSGGDDENGAADTAAVVVQTVADEPESTTTSEATTTTEPTTTSEASTTTEPSPYLIDTTPERQDGAETSQTATVSGQLPVKVYDPFSPDEGGQVNGVRWEGIYCQLIEGGSAPEPHATGFTIELYQDAGGGPDLGTGPIWSSAFDLAEVNETLTTTIEQTCGAEIKTTWAYYEYEVTLASPFEIEAGQAYWLSIEALTPNFNTFWGWRTTTSDAADSVQEFDGVLNPVFGGRAFALLR